MRNKIISFSMAALLLAGLVYAAAPDGAGGPWADEAGTYTQGFRKDGLPVLANRSDATQALGKAETTGAISDPIYNGTWFSLGFGGGITLKFDNSIVNGGGNDLMVYEVTGGSYPDEGVKVEASVNGEDWVTLSEFVSRDGAVDLGDLACAHYVRITDKTNKAIHTGDADGYDLDGVKALNWDDEACVVDEDEDGIDDDEDMCPTGTVADVLENDQGVNRWTYDGEGWMTVLPKGKGNGPRKEYSLEDTMGCSCIQILDYIKAETGDEMRGHYKFGCSSSILDEWISGFFFE